MNNRKKNIGRQLFFLIVTLLLLEFNLVRLTADGTEKTTTVENSVMMQVMQMPGKKIQNVDGSQQQPVYACPMHPDEISHEPGSCSQCGMFLVLQSDSDNISSVMPAMDHQHDEIYVCPMHPDEISHEPGSCSQCGMFLVKAEQGSESGMVHTAEPETAVMNMKAQAEMNMLHEKMPESAPVKPALFWDNQESQSDDHNHQHQTRPETASFPDTQRMSAPLPTISGVADLSNSLPPAETAEQHAKKHLDETYVCPMHPQIIQHEPGGHCPICGMDLVAREIAVSSNDAAPQVYLSSAVIQNMGVRTAKVQRKIIDKTIQTQGLVTADDDRLLSIHPRTGGWIEVLHLITEGDRVERKEVLVDFYSPWINQVQLNFITALEEYDMTSFDPSRKTELGAKVEALRNSLRLLNVMDMDIMRIKNSRKVQNTIQLMAPQGGIVTRLNVNEGSYVEPYESMFTIVDLSQVWVMVDIYEHQAPWVRKGHKVEITAPAIPGRSWNGEIDFIYPQVDPKTRTLRARISLPNPDEALLLNMFVKVDITANLHQQAVLTVPREAVILTGKRQSVIKVLDKGHFQPVEVSTGKRGDGRVEILSGLELGEEIVVSGQFLIDSESSLQASFLRMSE